MPTPDTATHLFDLADRVALVSGQLLRARLRLGDAIDDDRKTALMDMEGQLDQLTADLRARGTDALVAAVAGQMEEIRSATEQAEGLLRRIRNVQRILGIATATLELGLAVIAGKPAGIAKAVKSLKDKVRSEPGAAEA